MQTNLEAGELEKRKNVWVPEQQNIFRILLKLSQIVTELGGVLGREAPQNTSYFTFKSAKVQKNLENILCSGIKPIFAFGDIRPPDLAASFFISVDKLLSSQLQQNKAFHLTDFAQ